MAARSHQPGDWPRRLWRTPSPFSFPAQFSGGVAQVQGYRGLQRGERKRGGEKVVQARQQTTLALGKFQGLSFRPVSRTCRAVPAQRTRRLPEILPVGGSRRLSNSRPSGSWWRHHSIRIPSAPRQVSVARRQAFCFLVPMNRAETVGATTHAISLEELTPPGAPGETTPPPSTQTRLILFPERQECGATGA